MPRNQQFFTELDNAIAEFSQQAGAFAVQIATQLFQDIVNGNPYWSGRSKASWVISLNAPIEYIADDVPKRAGGITVSEAEERALATLVNLNGFLVGQTIYITNGNPYVEYLEKGRSKQAPDGFVALALTRYQGLGNFQVHY